MRQFAMILSCSFALVMVHAVQANVLIEEDFESYTLGTINGQGVDDATYTGAWSSSTSHGIVTDVSADPLTWGFIHGGDQALVNQRSRGGSPERFFDTDINPTDADPIYIRYLYRASVSATDGFFYDSEHNWDHAYFGFRSNPEISIRYNNVVEAPTGPDQTETQMVVARITGSTVDMWVNSWFETDTPVVSRTSVERFDDIGGIAFGAGANNSALRTFDELVIATSFSDVVPIPEPTAAALLLIGGIAMSMRRKRA